MFKSNSPIAQKISRITDLAVDGRHHIGSIRNCIEQQMSTFKPEGGSSHSLTVSLYGQKILFRVEVELESTQTQDLFPKGFIRAYAISCVEPKETRVADLPFPNTGAAWTETDRNEERDAFAAKLLNEVLASFSKNKIPLKFA